MISVEGTKPGSHKFNDRGNRPVNIVDIEEYSNFYGSMWPHVVSYFAVRLGAGSGDPEDVAQDLFIRLYFNWMNIKPRQDGGIESARIAYTFKSAYRLFLNTLRGNSRKGGSSLTIDYAEVIPDSHSSGNPEKTALINEEMDELNKNLTLLLERKKITEEDREMLILSGYQLSHREIAGVLGKDSDFVKSRLFKSRGSLRKVYKALVPGEGVEPSQPYG